MSRAHRIEEIGKPRLHDPSVYNWVRYVLVQAREWRYTSQGTGPEVGGDAGEKNVRTEGPVDQVPGLPGSDLEGRLEANLNVCPKCQHHFKLSARQRIELLLEPGL